MKTVSILGCGWLGWPLAKALKDQGYHVKGSTTSPDKLGQLRNDGIEAYLIDCHPQMNQKGIGDFLKTDALFLNIPFRRALENPDTYRIQIESVIDRLEEGTRLIFASSTSVYPEHIDRADEDAVFHPDNPRSRVLWEIERETLARSNNRPVVLRFAGLYGGNRRLGHFAAKVSRDPDSPVNLVHLDDCVNIVMRLISSDLTGVFNVCSDEHPTRRVLYTKAAQWLGVPAPVFESQGGASGKIVDNQKIKKALAYSFQHPDPLDAL